jgi:acetyl-CoA carboxylase carboxyltransferase component
MCGKAYDPRLIIAWPTARIAVMGGEQASDVLLNLEKNRLKKMGEENEEKKKKEEKEEAELKCVMMKKKKRKIEQHLIKWKI